MHIMVDIETLGVSPDSVILQIGAVGFNTAGMDSKGFECNVSVLDQLAINNSIDSQTVGWWFDTVDSDARHSVFGRDNIIPLHDALDTLNTYIKRSLAVNKTKSDKVWANSPTFDLTILRNAMQKCGIEPAWKYYEEADVRTLKYICNEELKINDNSVFEGVPHNALDDATNQADFVVNLLGSIREIKAGAYEATLKNKE